MLHTPIKPLPNKKAQSPAISVIVPVFNAERTIRRCLCSLAAQTMRDMEILVVYRPGHDNTWECIHSIGDPRIRIITQEDDLSPGRGRNLGINNAVGTYIGFLEADDFVDANFYEDLYRNIEFYGADIAFGEIFDGNSKAAGAVGELSGFTEIINSLCNGATFDKLFRTTLIKEHHIRFSEGLRWEDNIFIVKAAYFARSVVTVSHAFYHYCPSSWTEDYRRRLERDAPLVVHEIAVFARDVELSLAEMTALRAFIFRSFLQSVWGVPAVYRAVQESFSIPLSQTLRHYLKRTKRLLRNAKQVALKGGMHD